MSGSKNWRSTIFIRPALIFAVALSIFVIFTVFCLRRRAYFQKNCIKTREIEKKQFLSNFPQKNVQNWDFYKKRLPGAIIIGVKKAGTRALLEYLKLHPCVRAPGPEVHFFDRFHDQRMEWYRNQMPPSWPWQITVEKTPSYFVTKDAPARIHAMNSKVKIILVVRDPVTRAISDYTQNASKRPGMPSFDQMALLNRTTGQKMVNVSWGAIKIGLYHKHVKRWLKYFTIGKSMHLVDGQNLITRPAFEARLVEEFLGLEPFIEPRYFVYENQRIYRHKSIKRSIINRGVSEKSINQSTIDNTSVDPVTTTNFPCILNSVKKSSSGGRRKKPQCLGKTKGRRHAHVSPETLEILAKFYVGKNEKFFRLVGRRFDW